MTDHNAMAEMVKLSRELVETKDALRKEQVKSGALRRQSKAFKAYLAEAEAENKRLRAECERLHQKNQKHRNEFS